MKKYVPVLLIILQTTLLPAGSQGPYRKNINIPDIPGYVTLKCDFHMHTVFSDGLVWPTVRIDEAWKDGLDVIAITDHIEYQPFRNDIVINHNRSFEIAKPYADEAGIILIRGTEITRSMPPGHLNALFIQDAGKIKLDDWRQALLEAKNQGAYVFWNHPGWRQPDEIPVWYDEHTEIFSQNLAQGMEIVNERSYYPLAFRWCLEKNITIIGNSDAHNPIHLDYDPWNGDHRAITLVFASEKTESAVREALDLGRTAVWHKNLVLGKKELLEPLFYNSMRILNPNVTVRGTGRALIQVENISDVPMHFERTDSSAWFNAFDRFSVPGNQVSGFALTVNREMPVGIHEIVLRYRVNTFVIGPEEGLPVELKIRINHLK